MRPFKNTDEFIESGFEFIKCPKTSKIYATKPFDDDRIEVHKEGYIAICNYDELFDMGWTNESGIPFGTK